MGDMTLAKVDNLPDAEANPVAPNNTTGHREEKPQGHNAQDSGSAQAPGEQQKSEPAWQGVPL